MATTPHTGATLVEQAQAQKEVTVNMALIRLDALLNAGAVSRNAATPPVFPAEGDVYIIGVGAAGAWGGQDGNIAYFNQIWRFITPNEGATLWVQEAQRHYVYAGSEWVPENGRVMVPRQVAASYTLTKEEAGTCVELEDAGAITLTLPATLPKGFRCTLMQAGVGRITCSPASGAILLNRSGHTGTAGQYAVCTLYVSANTAGTNATYILSGDTNT